MLGTPSAELGRLKLGAPVLALAPEPELQPLPAPAPRRPQDLPARDPSDPEDDFFRERPAAPIVPRPRDPPPSVVVVKEYVDRVVEREVVVVKRVRARPKREPVKILRVRHHVLTQSAARPINWATVLAIGAVLLGGILLGLAIASAVHSRANAPHARAVRQPRRVRPR